MKEELNTKLVEILTSIQTAAGKASDFALEQLPDIAQSYVLYGRVFSLVTVLLCLAVLLALVWLFRVTYRATSEGDADEIVWVPVGIGGVVVVVIAMFFLLEGLQSTFLVWFAPKVWLLKELASLIK